MGNLGRVAFLPTPLLQPWHGFRSVNSTYGIVHSSLGSSPFTLLREIRPERGMWGDGPGILRFLSLVPCRVHPGVHPGVQEEQECRKSRSAGKSKNTGDVFVSSNAAHPAKHPTPKGAEDNRACGRRLLVTRCLKVDDVNGRLPIPLFTSVACRQLASIRSVQRTDMISKVGNFPQVGNPLRHSVLPQDLLMYKSLSKQ